MKLRILFFCFLIFGNNILTKGQRFFVDTTKPEIFIASCYGSAKYEEKKPLHQDWANIDVNNLKNKINLVPKNSNTIPKLKRILPDMFDSLSNSINVNEELGYNLKTIEYEIAGGYGSYTVNILYFDTLIIKLSLSIHNSSEIIEQFLEPAMKLPFYCSNGVPTYEKVFFENIVEYEKRNTKLFLVSIDTNERRKNAINYFTDCMTNGVFKSPYYVRFGIGNETFNNLRYFIVNKDYSSLESILFCPNPTSRLFAARALLYIKEKYFYSPTPEISLRMSKEVSNAKMIKSGILSCWIGKFEYDYYDVIKNFETYLLTE
jgi:hypothetical protein